MRKSAVLIGVLGVALIGVVSAFLLFFNQYNNRIAICNKKISDVATTNTIKDYVKGTSRDVTMSVYGFDPRNVSNIKTIYSLYRLNADPKSFINSNSFDSEQNQFLLKVLESQIEKKDVLTGTKLNPLSDSDYYFIKMLQKQGNLSKNFSYTLQDDQTNLQKVLDGEKLPKSSSIRFVESYSLINDSEDYTSINNLLANVLNLKNQTLSKKEIERLKKVWLKYQNINTTKVALLLPDVSFVIFGEAQKNLGEIIHEKGFLKLSKEDVSGTISQPVYYQMDNLKNVAFLYAAEYYTQNNVSRNQDTTIISELNGVSPKTSIEQYYLNVINNVRKDNLTGQAAISPIDTNRAFKTSNFFTYFVEDVKPKKNNEKICLDQCSMQNLVGSPKRERSLFRVLKWIRY